MATLRILVPEATTNFVKNPAARFDTTGWNAVGSTLTRTLTRARFGIASFQVVTNGATLYEGIYYRVNSLSGSSGPITVSAYLMGTGIVRVRLIDNPAGREWTSQPVTLRADRWTRVHVTGQSTGSNDVRLYVETDQVRAVTFYVDGAQMERKPYSTTYCDGDQEGCRWNIMEHNSPSIREPYTRAGGRWVTLAGEGRQEKNLYMTVVGGMGFAPILNHSQDYAEAPGGYYQSTKVMARPITLTFHAKHEDKTLRCNPQSLSYLHQLRQLLIDLIKPDRTRDGEEFILEYTDGDKPIYLKARYDGGLEGDWDVRNGWITSFPLRLLAVSPYFYEDDQQVTVLDFQDSPDANNVIARLDGEWENLNYGTSAIVQSFALGARGEVIAVGSFGLVNFNAKAIKPFTVAGGVAWWDGEKWNAYGSGSGANDVVYGVAVAPNGHIYVCGIFTAIDGIPANHVAYWDGSSWNALGSGVNAIAFRIAIAPNGDVYIVGDFTTAGGNPAYYIARWDGSTWHPVGSAGGLNASTFTLAISPNGSTLYAGGSFSDEFGNPGTVLTRVAKLDIATDTWEAMGAGLNDVVRDLRISPSGILYAGGDFTLSGSSNERNVALWNGGNWLGLGGGMSGYIAVSPRVFGIDIHTTGELIAVGDFTQAGKVDAGGAAIWNGTTWTNMDIQVAQYIPAVMYDNDGNIYLGAGSPIHVGDATLINNPGTAEVSPKVYIVGPATLKFIENYTARKRAYFDLDILNGEEVFIDFESGKVESNIRKDLSALAVLPGSDLKAFTLLPGENKITALMVNDIDAKMYMSFIPRHWSVDSTSAGDEL